MRAARSKEYNSAAGHHSGGGQRAKTSAMRGQSPLGSAVRDGDGSNPLGSAKLRMPTGYTQFFIPFLSGFADGSSIV